MRRVLLDMQNTLFAEGVSLALTTNNPSFDVRRAERQSEVEQMCATLKPEALIMEVARGARYSPQAREQLCARIRLQKPDCKFVYMLDENANGEFLPAVLAAKKSGLIDQFAFCSISGAYLAAIIEAL